MFAKSTASKRQVAIIDLINTHMTGGRVKDHCLTMISHISRAEVMRAKLLKGDEDRSHLAIIAYTIQSFQSQLQYA